MSEPVARRWAESVFAPVGTRNAVEVTVEQLARGVRLGVLAPGDRLPAERELAARLQVSRVTLRAALAGLRDAGLVRSRRGRGGGTFVVAPGARPRADAAQAGVGLDDALDLRRVVEPGVAELAAARTLTADDRADLQRYLAAATGAAPPQRRLADSRLHLALAALAGSASLTALVGQVQLRLDELLGAIPVIDANIAHSDRQHAAVVAAVLGGDAAGARREMTDHVDATAALLRGLLAPGSAAGPPAAGRVKVG